MIDHFADYLTTLYQLQSFFSVMSDDRMFMDREDVAFAYFSTRPEGLKKITKELRIGITSGWIRSKYLALVPVCRHCY
jgi:hypothetical protein